MRSSTTWRASPARCRCCPPPCSSCGRSGRTSTLTLAAYRESGGVHGAVARLAESTYARIPEERRPLVRAIMLRLVGEGEGQAPVRRRAPLAELDVERNEDAAGVLAVLSDSRLVTVSEGTVEVAHEALLREWPRLSGWIEEDGEGRRLRRHITQAAAGWDTAERDQGELYRGARLAAALDWSADHALEVNELEREFVTASREASEHETRRVRRTNRRLRALLAGSALLLVAAVAGGIFAAVQRGEARAAEAAQVAQRLGAQALVDEDLDRSLLLAREAVAIEDTPQTRGYLLKALLRAPKAIAVMHGPEDAELNGIAISPDGRTLAVTDFYRRILFFDARTYEQIGAPLVTVDWVDSVAYSRDGKTLAYGTGAYVRLIDARTREELAATSVEGRAARLAFTKDGERLVVMTDSAVIHVRDAATLAAVGSVRPRGFGFSFIQSYYRPPHLALAADGRSFLTASEEGELTVWDLGTLRPSRTFDVSTGYHALAVSPDGRIAAVGVAGGIQLVDLRSGEKRTATTGLAGTPNWLLFSPDGRTVVSANDDGTVTRIAVASAAARETLRGHSKGVQQLVFDSAGNELYTVGVDGNVTAWDLTGSRSVRRSFRFTHDRDFDRTYDGHPARFSPDGRLMAVGLKEEGVALLNALDLARSGKTFVETRGEVKVLAFSPDGRTLAAVTRDGDVTIWDVASRALRHRSISAGGYRTGVAFSPDGRTLFANGIVGGVDLWNVAAGAALGTIGAGGTGDVALSADGTLVAFAKASTGVARAQVWDAAKRTLVVDAEADVEGNVFSVALSPDGRLLAVGGYPRLVPVWDVRTGTLVHELDAGGGEDLEFSPDGRVLAVSGLVSGRAVSGGAVSLWDVATGTQIGPSLTAGERAVTIDLSPDGRALLMAAANGQGAVWDVDPKSWARRACTIANRTLTRVEWEKYLPGRLYEPACR